MEQELQLVRRAQSGDTGAFAQLYEGVYQDLYRFALYVLKHPQDAQDVVSDTVMDAFAQIGELRKSEAFRAWIFRILSNKCKRKLKEYATRPEELTPELLEHLGKSGMDEHAAVRSLFFELPSEERKYRPLKREPGNKENGGEILEVRNGRYAKSLENNRKFR